MYTSTYPIYNIPLYAEMENVYRHIKSKRRLSYGRIYQLIRYVKVNLNVSLPKLPFRDLYMKNYCVHCYGGMIACRGRLGVCVWVECLWTWLRTRLDLYYNALFLLAFVSYFLHSFISVVVIMMHNVVVSCKYSFTVFVVVVTCWVFHNFTVNFHNNIIVFATAS